MAKKRITVISIAVFILCIFVVSCSAKNGNGDALTTAVTDNQGNTVYYQVVSDENTTALAEIVTNENGKAVTNKNGDNVTKSSIADKSSQSHSSVTAQSSTSKNQTPDSTKAQTGGADNDIKFDAPSSNSNNSEIYSDSVPASSLAEQETTVPKTTEKIVTDKDGWIDKWY